MKTQILSAERGTLQFTRKNLGFPIPRRMTDLNEDTRKTNTEVENEESIPEEEKETEGPDENERIKDGFEWQEDGNNKGNA